MTNVTSPGRFILIGDDELRNVIDVADVVGFRVQTDNTAGPDNFFVRVETHNDYFYSRNGSEAAARALLHEIDDYCAKYLIPTLDINKVNPVLVHDSNEELKPIVNPTEGLKPADDED